MPDWLTIALGAIALSWVACFALGSVWNLKRGNDALRWLRGALPALGSRTTMQWLGTSIVKLTIAQAKDPFRDIEILVAMEPRDVPVLWAYGHLHGRRDTLIFRGNLRKPPAVEVEAINPGLWTGREGLAEVDLPAWSPVAVAADGHAATQPAYVTVAHGDSGPDQLRAWFARSTQLVPGLARLSVRRSATYQFQWHSTLPKLAAVSAADIVGLVRQIGQQAGA